VTRKNYLEMLALAAAAAASFATSAPPPSPPDWTQQDEAPPQALALSPGEDAKLTFFTEGPPLFTVALDIESDQRPTFDLAFVTNAVVVYITDGSALYNDPDCGAATIGVDDWSAAPSGEPARYHASYLVPGACYSDILDGAEVVATFRALTRPGDEQAWPATLYVTVRASAAGDDDQDQDPPVRVELR
jgi:hypothetical protein